MNQEQANNYVIMQQTVKAIKELLQKRLNNRVETLNAMSSVPFENLPEAVLKMREEEASKNRAVMQEQKGLIEIINAMFPDV